MIREVKIKKTKNKKIAKFKNNKKNSISKYEGKKTKYNVNQNSNHHNHHHNNQKGGNKEKFEIVRLADIDYSQFTLSKYVNTDIDWGDSPGKPPTTCCIL
jgi:hypothetical protein